jgi:hypothetical protein
MDRTVMRLPDGPGYSPDGGRGEVKGNIVYWEYGDVTDLNVSGIAVRWMPRGGFHVPNYRHRKEYHGEGIK